jgi:ribosome biogenesis GTPase
MPYEGKFRIKESTNPIVCGDVVDYELEESSDTVTVLHPQYSRERITSFGNRIYPIRCIIASNIDRVSNYHNPPTTFNFIDRFLVTAEAYGIETILVNKILMTKRPWMNNCICSMCIRKLI